MNSNSGPRDSEENAGEKGVGNDDNDDDFVTRPALRSTLTRHWTSLQDHADNMRAVTPRGGESTPRAQNRREGFAWEMPVADEPHSKLSPRNLPNPSTPFSIANAHQSQEDTSKSRATSSNGSDAYVPHSSYRRTSTASSFADRLSRKDTARSSISSIAKGLMRHVPDVMMFNPNEKSGRDEKCDSNDVHEDSHRPGSKSSRSLSFKLPVASRRIGSYERATKNVQVLDRPDSKSSQPNPSKGGLKNRRKMDNAEAMKLTLPLELPDLPPRKRKAMSVDLRNIAPPRPRSPKTPWIHDTPPSWQPPTELATGPPMIFEAPFESQSNKSRHGLLPGSDPIQSSLPPKFNGRPARVRDRYYTSRPRYNRGRSHTSDSSRARTSDIALSPDETQIKPVNEQSAKTKEELKELSNRSRRWRWSGPWTSTDTASTDSPSHELSDRRFSFGRYFRYNKKPGRIPLATAPQTQSSNNATSWRGKEAISKSYDNPLANMPVPPTFVPPGLHRVLTPPIFDQTGEVKGKLADFFFDLQGVKKSKPSPGIPGRIWDSDALLMSQESDITAKSSSSGESPQGLASETTTPVVDGEKLTPSGYMTANAYFIPGSPHSPIHAPPTTDAQPPEWFPTQLGDDVLDIFEAEEKAKYEWLTPEHLPGSPLCPLSPKYRGPNRGICVYHGRRKDSAGSGFSGLPSERLDVLKHQRRRLVSLSSP